MQQTEEWWDSAACRDLSSSQKDNFFADSKAKINAAKRICEKCPVVSACLFYALRSQEADGVWGGCTPKERRRMRTLLATAGPNLPHGLPALATSHA